MGDSCEICGKSTMHTIWNGDGRKHYCCRCYVLHRDGAPSDWHPGCLAAYREKTGRSVALSPPPGEPTVNTEAL